MIMWDQDRATVRGIADGLLVALAHIDQARASGLRREFLPGLGELARLAEMVTAGVDALLDQEAKKHQVRLSECRLWDAEREAFVAQQESSANDAVVAAAWLDRCLEVHQANEGPGESGNSRLIGR
jgi:hypothetical protein